MPQKIKSTSGMSVAEGLLYWTLIVCTCGF